MTTNKKLRDDIVSALYTTLDTRDKRFIFLKMLYPKELPHIDIEGSPYESAYKIFFEFEKRGILYDLATDLNKFLGYDIKLSV